MKTVILCFACLVLLWSGFSVANAARPGGKAPEAYRTINDNNYYMLFDGTGLSVMSKGEKLMQFVCMVSGRFPDIEYNGDYAVTGPRYPNDPDRAKVIVKRTRGHNSIELKH